MLMISNFIFVTLLVGGIYALLAATKRKLKNLSHRNVKMANES